MRHHCHSCAYTYEREQGYFLGAMYISYGLTCVLGLALFFTIAGFVDWPAPMHLLYILPFVILFPVVFFRYSRLLWMVMDVFISTPAAEDFLPDPEDPSAGSG